MTKEQVEKHGEVIKWFVDNPDKGVWTKRFNSDDDDWTLIAEPSWLTNWQYIQNDEKAELRKQVADGAILQYYDNGKWKDATHISATFSECKLENLRIKPQFKVGSWVVNIKYKIIFQATKEWVIKRPNGNTHFTGKDEDFISWEPKKDELCIFWNNHTPNEYIIAHYTHVVNITDASMYSKAYWDNVAPLEFIKTLKENRTK